MLTDFPLLIQPHHNSRVLHFYRNPSLFSQSRMVALTYNRYKRDAEFQSPSPSGFNNDHPHISKKLKSSNWNSNSTKSAVSRLCLYPQHVSPVLREIQAPCIVVKGFTRQKSNVSGVKTVNVEMEDDIVEVTDVQTVNNENDVLEDSGVEVIAVVESEKEEVNKLGDIQTIRAKYRELNEKAEEKALESLSLNQRPDDGLDLDAGLIFHKEMLYDSVKKRDERLRRLGFDIGFLEVKRALSKQLIPAKKDVDVLVEPFRPLGDDDLEMVANALSNSSRRKVLVTHENSNITIAGEVLRCLQPRAWLNDEVINLYLELLKEREKREPKKFLKCHFFNTFFYKKLISGRMGYDYKSVRRWTTQRKLGYSLLECDKFLSLFIKKYIGVWLYQQKKKKSFSISTHLEELINK